MLGNERDGVQRGDAGLLHDERDVRALHLGRAVFGDEAGLQHRDARVPRVRWRRRVWRGDAGV